MGDQKLSAQHSPVSFLDRAIPDIVAYLRVGRCEVKEEFIEQSANYHSKVLTCRPESSIYVQDEVRPHTFDEALQIHQTLVDTYVELGYEVVEVPWGALAERVEFVKTELGLQG
jgi:predicted ATPase